MPNPAITRLIAERLPSLVHPGDEQHDAAALPLPIFRASAIPPEMAQHFANQAGLPDTDVPRLFAEAIVHLIETDGASEIVTRSELDQLRTAATIHDGTRTVTVHCRCDTSLTNPLLVLTIGNADHTTIMGKQLIDGLANRTPNCPHQVIT